MYELLFLQTIQSPNEVITTSEPIEGNAEIQQVPTGSQDTTNNGTFII